MNIRSIFLLLILISFFIKTNAQKDSLDINITTDTVTVSTEKLLEKEHKPSVAILASAILPGAGQAYNKQYWKIPVIYSVLGTTAFTVGYFNKKYQKYKDGLIKIQEHQTDTTVIIPPLFENEEESSVTQYMDKFRRNRDLSGLVFLAVYALNLIDATVYAHLTNFDVSDDLSLRIQPEVIPLYAIKNKNTIGLSISFNF